MPEDFRTCLSNLHTRLFLLCVHLVRLTTSQMCLPSYHNVFTNDQTYEILGRRDFNASNDGNYFLPMVLDRKINGTRLIVGAKDYVYYIDAVTLQELRALSWKSDEQKKSKCLSSKSKDSCSNYIHFLVIYNNKLFVCGTNSMSPKYRLISLDNFDVIEEKVAYDVCSSRRDSNMVGEMTELGELISGSYTDFQQNRPIISGIYVAEKNARRTLKTETQSEKHLKDPQFVSSVSVGDSVYIFVMEKAVEDGDSDTSTVVRVCKGDNGGSKIIGSDRWTTYRKSRLRCVVTKDGVKFVFRKIVHVVYDPTKKVFFAAFTMFQHLNMHSAICTFKRTDVDATFAGNFLDIRRESKINMSPVPNGGFLKNGGCRVNTHNMSRIVASNNGKQPTNYLSIPSLKIAMHYNLMQSEVKSSPEVFQMMLTGFTFTRLLVIPTNKAGPSVISVGTDAGSIIMMYKNRRSQPCVIKEIKTDIGYVQNLLLNEDQRILYVGSTSKISKLDVDSCHVYTTENICIQAHNPLCGWSKNIQKCVATWNENNTVQDLMKCPRRTHYLGQWTAWEPCEFSSKKYCRCRSRSCDSCDAAFCNDQSLFEVKNCSSNSVMNVDQWMEKGATDGGWSVWSDWSSCGNSICGNRTMSKNRTCTSPPPSNGGNNCVGDSILCKACPEKVIKIGVWSKWSNWGGCFKSSGGYIMNRTRTCNKPDGCMGVSSKTLPCTPQGIKWGPWSICSCAQSVRHRLPVLVDGCDTNCTVHTLAQYEVCKPISDCYTPTETTTIAGTTMQETTQQETTPQETTQGEKQTKIRPTINMCTPVPTPPDLKDLRFSETTHDVLAVSTTTEQPIQVIGADKVSNPCEKNPNTLAKSLYIRNQLVPLLIN